MRSVRLALALGVLLLLPALGNAQTLAGVVKDSSGAVLPGVTVEAASPALIEKVRATTTDAAGQYKIDNLRVGTYSLTFTLTGFARDRPCPGPSACRSATGPPGRIRPVRPPARR